MGGKTKAESHTRIAAPSVIDHCTTNPTTTLKLYLLYIVPKQFEKSIISPKHFISRHQDAAAATNHFTLNKKNQRKNVVRRFHFHGSQTAFFINPPFIKKKSQFGIRHGLE